MTLSHVFLKFIFQMLVGRVVNTGWEVLLWEGSGPWWDRKLVPVLYRSKKVRLKSSINISLQHLLQVKFSQAAALISISSTSC